MVQGHDKGQESHNVHMIWSHIKNNETTNGDQKEFSWENQNFQVMTISSDDNQNFKWWQESHMCIWSGLILETMRQPMEIRRNLVEKIKTSSDDNFF